MSIHLPIPDPETLLLTGFLSFVFGVVWLLGRSVAFAPRLLASILAGALTVGAAPMVLPVADVQTVLVFAGGSLLMLLLLNTRGIRSFVRAGWRQCSRPEFSGFWLLFAGAGCLALACANTEPDPASLFEEPLLPPPTDGAALVPVPGLEAFTDKGTPIPVGTIWHPMSMEYVMRSEAETLRLNRFNHQYIRIASASNDCNCHGWVFANGRAWIRGAEVDSILKENGYSVVAGPAPGDLVIYRDSSGYIVHTALVRGFWGSNRVLVESKWGSFGVFLHFAETSIYGEQYHYYRTARSTHVLNGLEKSSGQETAGARPGPD